MKMQDGKIYVLKSGQVVGPVFSEFDEVVEYTIFMSDDLVEGLHPIWREDGKADFFLQRTRSPILQNEVWWDVVKEFDKHC